MPHRKDLKGMHELPVMESILTVVLKHGQTHGVHKILAIQLRVGELTDLVDEWMQRYFDYLSKDTMAAGAILKIERTPAVFQCATCSTSFPADVRNKATIACPACSGEDVALKSGREYYIKNIEVI